MRLLFLLLLALPTSALAEGHTELERAMQRVLQDPTFLRPMLSLKEELHRKVDQWVRVRSKDSSLRSDCKVLKKNCAAYFGHLDKVEDMRLEQERFAFIFRRKVCEFKFDAFTRAFKVYTQQKGLDWPVEANQLFRVMRQSCDTAVN